METLTLIILIVAGIVGIVVLEFVFKLLKIMLYIGIPTAIIYLIFKNFSFFSDWVTKMVGG